MAKTGGNYLQIKASIAQKLPGRNGSFLHIFLAFSAGYPAIYRSAWLHGAKQFVTT